MSDFEADVREIAEARERNPAVSLAAVSALAWAGMTVIRENCPSVKGQE